MNVTTISNIRNPVDLVGVKAILLKFVRGRLDKVHQDRAARMLRELDPRLARDIGSVAALNGCPTGFAVDPRPLWGIGLTPQPLHVVPPSRQG